MEETSGFLRLIAAVRHRTAEASSGQTSTHRLISKSIQKGDLKMKTALRVFSLLALLALVSSTITISANAQKASAEKIKGQRNVAILIFKDVQIIDYTGPYEVFVNASSNNYDRFNIYTVSETADPLTTIGGMTVTPKYSFGNYPPPNIIVIPGGWGVYAQRKNPKVIEWIQQNARRAEVVLSVCNGAFLLSKAGLLDGLAATTTSGAVDELKKEVPSLKPVYDQRFVDTGKIVTSAGLTAGIDAALQVVEKTIGKGWAQKIAIDMEYHWQPESKYSRALFADTNVPPTWWLFPDLQCDPFTYEGGEDHWENKSIVQTSLSPAQLLERVQNRITGNKNLSWVKKGESASPTRSIWDFNDRKGRPWKGLIIVESIAGETGKLMLTIKIARPDSPAAKSLK
jgi:putative intracellular protease/amidase